MGGMRENKSYDLELMLWIQILQNLYTMFDEGTVTKLRPVTFSQIFGLESSNQISNGYTSGRFRNLFIENSSYKQFFHLLSKPWQAAD